MSSGLASKPCAHCGAMFQRDPRNTWAYWEKAKYCCQLCAGRAWSAESAIRRPPMAEAFAKHVARSDGCWEWTGLKDKDGYGLFPYARKPLRANMVALQLDGRPVPRGMYACHRCDNPSCVRPDHLYPGTPAQNSRDAISRGRSCCGERQHMAKLNESAVRAIRASSAHPKELAERYNVSPAAIYMIRNGKTWKHVA